LKKFLLIIALTATLIIPASAFVSASEPKTCELPQKTAYNLEYQGVGFFSNLVISLFGKSIFEDSKTFTLEESLSCQTQKELKIANPKKTLVLISRDGETYSGITNFKERTNLGEETAKNLLALGDFVESGLRTGDTFSMVFTMNSKNYLATVKVAKIENCDSGKTDCSVAEISALIVNKDNKKLISIEAKIKKEGLVAGKIKTIEIKTLFWPTIIVRISEKR
jgi:hypothetical protein